jgi:hypothetical protein
MPWLVQVADEASPAPAPAAAPRTLDHAGTRLAVFAIALILALVAGFAIGRATTTSTQEQQAAQPGVGATTMPGDGHGHQHGGSGATAGASGEIGGLTVSAGGYRLVPERTVFAAGTPQPFSFQVRGPDLLPVTSYITEHEKELHLIVVRRDLTGYQHLHPVRAGDGTWSLPLTLSTPGWYRAIADFTVADSAGRQIALTLAIDLVAPGAAAVAELPAPAKTATAGGFTVSHDANPQPGVTMPVNLRVEGATLERYLGSYGHLVVLREGDLAYLHVHPEEQLVGGAVRFWMAAPSLGRYRAFFDFQVAGKVNTAEFTLVVS